MKRRFAILHRETRLKPEKVAKVFDACAVLHNIATDLNLADIPVDAEVDDEVIETPVNTDLPVNSAVYRDIFAQNIFG